MPTPDRLSPGQRVRLIHWLDGRLVRGPCGMVESIIDGRQFRGCRPWMAALVALDLGHRVPAYLYELEMVT